MSEIESARERRCEAVHLITSFYRHLDESDHESLAALMHPEGVWHRQGQELRDRNAILEAMSRRSPTRRIHHLLTNVFANLGADGGEAEVIGYMLVVRHESGTVPEGPSPLEGIENIRTIRARLRDTPDGWKIERLRSDPPSFARAAV